MIAFGPIPSRRKLIINQKHFTLEIIMLKLMLNDHIFKRNSISLLTLKY